jgi:hypothetical protein
MKVITLTVLLASIGFAQGTTPLADGAALLEVLSAPSTSDSSDLTTSTIPETAPATAVAPLPTDTSPAAKTEPVGTPAQIPLAYSELDRWENEGKLDSALLYLESRLTLPGYDEGAVRLELDSYYGVLGMLPDQEANARRLDELMPPDSSTDAPTNAMAPTTGSDHVSTLGSVAASAEEPFAAGDSTSGPSADDTEAHWFHSLSLEGSGTYEESLESSRTGSGGLGEFSFRNWALGESGWAVLTGAGFNLFLDRGVAIDPTEREWSSSLNSVVTLDSGTVAKVNQQYLAGTLLLGLQREWFGWRGTLAYSAWRDRTTSSSGSTSASRTLGLRNNLWAELQSGGRSSTRLQLTHIWSDVSDNGYGTRVAWDFQPTGSWYLSASSSLFRWRRATAYTWANLLPATTFGQTLLTYPRWLDSLASAGSLESKEYHADEWAWTGEFNFEWSPNDRWTLSLPLGATWTQSLTPEKTLRLPTGHAQAGRALPGGSAIRVSDNDSEQQWYAVNAPTGELATLLQLVETSRTCAWLTATLGLSAQLHWSDALSTTASVEWSHGSPIQESDNDPHGSSDLVLGNLLMGWDF